MKASLRIVASIGFLVAFAVCFAQKQTRELYWTPLKAQIEAKNGDWLERLEDELTEFDDFQEDLATLQESKPDSAKWKLAYNSTLERVSRYAVAETATVDAKSATKAREILARREYTSVKDAPGKNWLERILERIKNLKMDRPNTPDINFPDLPWLGPLLRGLMYLLAAVAAGVLIWLLTKLRAGAIVRRNRTRGGGILEEGEELLSEDEYLANADQLIAEGRFREACRALYLAMLVRLDASRIARLEPAQTNWEHLRRVEANTTKPEGLDFRTPTKLFDHAWYGYTARSALDVEPFRAAYLDIKRLTETKKEAA